MKKLKEHSEYPDSSLINFVGAILSHTYQFSIDLTGIEKLYTGNEAYRATIGYNAQGKPYPAIRKTKEATQFIEEIKNRVQSVFREDLNGTYCVEVLADIYLSPDWWIYKNNNVRRVDLTNVWKTVEDALKEGIQLDDCLSVGLNLNKCISKNNPRIDIILNVYTLSKERPC